MKPTAGYVPLRKIVDDYKLEADLTDSADFRLWNLAVRGLDKIGMDLFTEPVTRKLGINPNFTVDLPQDYLNWVKVGVLNGRGEIATLVANPELSSNAVIAHDRLENNSDPRINVPDSKWFLGYRNCHWGDTYRQYLGAASGPEVIGEFDVKSDEGLIYLSNKFQYDYIILEYLPVPSATEDFLVPMQAVECIIAWIAWRDIINKPASRRVNNQEKMLRKREFYNMRSQCRRSLRPFRIPEGNDTIRGGFKLAVKS